MAIEKVVKVMNFHSLLRVDKSKKIAEKYFNTEIELTKMIAKILYNRNLILDKKTLNVSDKAPVLSIYIGNDYGFCGSFNSAINQAIFSENEYDKVIIGKKVYAHDDKVLLELEKDDFEKSFSKIEKIINDAISSRKYREINVLYNHYYSISDLKFVKKRIFPIDLEEQKDMSYNEDFIVETDVNKMLEQLVSLYVCYELRICFRNSNAAENIMRQSITKDSLKKIDEINEERNRQDRKERKYRSFQKSIEISRNIKQE